MPIDKAELVLPAGWSIDPKGSYVRVAKVLTVSIMSRWMKVQFIDGDSLGGGIYAEEPVDVLTIMGFDEDITAINTGSTTYCPSAAVYGRGDIANIVVIGSGEMYAVSLADDYFNINRENFALVKGWALHDVLGGILVDSNDSGVNSFLTFWNPATHDVVKITGDPEERNVFRRLLDHFVYENQNCFDVSHVSNAGYPGEMLNSGPRTNLPYTMPRDTETQPEHAIHFSGKNVNGFDYVEDLLFAEASMDAKLSMYHSTELNLDTQSIHPQIASVVKTTYNSGTVFYFGEEDPEFVLVACCYPAWVTAPYIKFVEVPVYSLAGRKYLARDIIDEDLPTEEKNIVQSWQRYTDQVREVLNIPRNYINWAAHEDNELLSERLQRAMLVYTPRPDPLSPNGPVAFGYLDGFGYDLDGSILTPNKIRKVLGSVSRTEIAAGDPSYTNGSRYIYEISATSPQVVDNFYNTKFEYEFGGDPVQWERQTNNNPTKEYPHFVDGDNNMHIEFDYDYYCVGQYADELKSGTAYWSDRTLVGGASAILNQFTRDVYRNGVIIWSDFYTLEMVSNVFFGGHKYHYCFYADVPLNLYILEKVEITIDQSSNSLGPGAACTGELKRTALVLFQGVEYILWTVTSALTTFPAVWNFWPWILDASSPARPDPPYSVNTDYNSVFFNPPWFSFTTDPASGYYVKAGGYPTPSDDACSFVYVSVRDQDEHSLSDFLSVSIDSDTDSFGIYFKCPWNVAGATLNYPNGDDKCYRFNGGAIHFNNPPETSTIDLSDAIII